MRRDLVPTAAAPQVLRNVVLQQSPHALTRPRSALAMAPQPARASAAEIAAPVSLAPAPETAQQAREAAIARAYEQGQLDGRAAVRDELERDCSARLDEARRAAVEEGRRQGFEQGQARAHAEADETAARLAAEARDELAGRVQRLDALLAAVPEQLRKRLDEAEDDLLALCHEVVCRMLGEAAATPAGLRAQLNLARQQLGAHSAVAAHLHPQDWAALQAAGMLDAPPGVQWVADDEVKIGGLLLRTPQGSLDARLEQQMASLQATLLAVRSRSAGTASAAQEDAA